MATLTRDIFLQPTSRWHTAQAVNAEGIETFTLQRSQNFWKPSIWLFLLMALEVNIVRSRPQKASQVFTTVVNLWLS